MIVKTELKDNNIESTYLNGVIDFIIFKWNMENNDSSNQYEECIIEIHYNKLIFFNENIGKYEFNLTYNKLNDYDFLCNIEEFIVDCLDIVYVFKKDECILDKTLY